MINTQTQIDSLIDLAVIQRTELKQLIESLPQLRDHLSSEIERNLEEIEPAIRSELEQFVAARALDTQAKTSAELSAKLDAMARNLESTTAAKYSVLMAERAQNATLLAQAEARIAEAASALPGAVKGIVTDELSRFPRAGEIDQLRREFAEPRGLNPRGRWQVGETYNKLDLVSYNGDSYVSSTDGNREKPSRSTDAWTLSAARGNGGGGGGVTSLTDLVAVPANGELLIGNGSAFVNNTITGGTGVTVTNGPGTITIDASGAQELLTATVTNAESFAITRGQVVYLFGATGNRASVKLADNSNDAASSKTFGVVSQASISAGGNGLVTCVGVVTQLTLGTYTEGDVLYLGATPGAFTNVKPYAPNHLVYVGMVERANNGNGEVYVRIQNGFELDEIHDVQITTPPLAGALLMRDATNSLWKANRLTGTANQVTVTNADTAVTLSLPTTIANVNSVTAQTATNLTLAGGSTGASLVLGQGSAGGITGTSLGAGRFAIVSAGGGTSAATLRNTSAAGFSALDWFDDTGAQKGGIGYGNASGAVPALASKSYISSTVDLALFVNGATRSTLTTTGNLLIGGTTDITGSGGLKVFGTTAASTSQSGAFQVGGSTAALSVGIGGGNVNAGGGLTLGSNIEMSAATNIRFNGGTGLIYTGGYSYALSLQSSQLNLNTLSNSPITTGSGLATFGGAATFAGAVTVSSTTASTNTTSGALVVTGGVGVGGALNVGGAATFAGAVTSTGNLTVTNGATPLFLAVDTRTSAGGGLAALSLNTSDQLWQIQNNGGNLLLRDNTAAVTAVTITKATGAATFAGAVTVAAATTARASMRIPHGTAPTSPVDGDMWTTSAGLYIRINGATVGPLS